jgi:cold shock CspA family protein
MPRVTRSIRQIVGLYRPRTVGLLAYGVSMIGVICARLIIRPEQRWLLWPHACFFRPDLGARGPARTSPGPKGPQVTEIISVDASTASQEPPRRPRPERPAYPSRDRATVEELGTVKWYNANEGFGFIAPDQGGKDIFVHASALERAGIMGLAEGQRVAIDVAQGQKGPEAVGLRVI